MQFPITQESVVGVNSLSTPKEYIMSINECAFDGMNELKNETETYLRRFRNTYEFVASVYYI